MYFFVFSIFWEWDGVKRGRGVCGMDIGCEGIKGLCEEKIGVLVVVVLFDSFDCV